MKTESLMKSIRRLRFVTTKDMCNNKVYGIELMSLVYEIKARSNIRLPDVGFQSGSKVPIG